MGPEPLNEREEAFRRWLIQYKRKHGYAPKYREMMTGFGFKSTSHVRYMLDKLQAKGHLHREPGSAGAIALLNERFTIPFCGKVAAGLPITLRDNTGESVEVTADLVAPSNDVYALQVEGNSLIDAMIRNGDLLLVAKTSQVDNGQLAVVRVPTPAFPEGETTCKYLHEREELITLRPDNPAYPSMHFDRKDVEVVGRVVGVIRSELWGSLASPAPAA